MPETSSLSSKARNIIVLATLDTKGAEAQFVKDQIEGCGLQAILIDTSVVGRPSATADISREQVAEAGGVPHSKLLEKPTREAAAPVMAAGATRIVTELVSKSQAHGIISLGGTQGTTLSTKVMRALPYGFPKVMVSTMASGNVRPWVDVKDITMMFSVADILGLNAFTRQILANAAAAVCGMAGVSTELHARDQHLIAVTTVGITTRGATAAVEVLEKAGYQTIVFHANGAGGRAMEQMMREGIIDGVLDYATIEVSNELHQAMLAGDAERLTTAGRLGIPQVICPGAIEVLVFGEPDSVPERYRGRTLIRHSPQITDLRLNAAEMAEVGAEVARRLQHTQREAVFLLPNAGYDSYAKEGNSFYDPEADAAFVAELKARAPACVRIIERDTDIEDPDFAAEAANTLIALMAGKLAKEERDGGALLSRPVS
jgi:uncharacterized protein (UPF0261 family)